MEHKRLEPEIDVNDPEVGFSFSSDDDTVELSFVDWTNQRVTFHFYTTYVFSFRKSNGWKSLPEANVLEILNSSQIQDLRDDYTASKNEELHHYVVSTNEDEWCEVVAQRYTVEKAKG
jgi:hypothetical protein